MSQTAPLLVAAIAVLPAFAMALRIRWTLARADAELSAYFAAPGRAAWGPAAQSALT